MDCKLWTWPCRVWECYLIKGFWRHSNHGKVDTVQINIAGFLIGKWPKWAFFVEANTEWLLLRCFLGHWFQSNHMHHFKHPSSMPLFSNLTCNRVMSTLSVLSFSGKSKHTKWMTSMWCCQYNPGFHSTYSLQGQNKHTNHYSGLTIVNCQHLVKWCRMAYERLLQFAFLILSAIIQFCLH